MKIRVDDDLHAKLEASADRNGRTMNKEVIGRLQKSFEREASVLRTREAYGLSQLVGLIIEEVGGHAAFYAELKADNRFWANNAYAFGQATRAAHRILEAFRPPGDPSVPQPRVADPEGKISEVMGVLGIQTASILLGAIATGAEQPLWQKEIIDSVRDELGELASRLQVQSNSEMSAEGQGNGDR